MTPTRGYLETPTLWGNGDKIFFAFGPVAAHPVGRPIWSQVWTTGEMVIRLHRKRCAHRATGRVRASCRSRFLKVVRPGQNVTFLDTLYAFILSAQFEVGLGRDTCPHHTIVPLDLPGHFPELQSNP